MTAPKRVLISLVLLTALLFAPLYLLFYTTQGSRFLVDMLQEQLAGSIAVARVQGCLADTLQLEDIRLNLDHKPQTVSRLTLTWRPASLLRGRVEIDTLSVQGVQLDLPPSDGESEPPGDLPDLSALPDILIGELRIADATLHLEPKRTLRLHSLALSGRLEQGELRIERLAIQADQGSLTGEAEVKLAPPFPVSATVDWSAPLPDGSAAQGQLLVAGDSRRLEVWHQDAGPLPLQLDALFEDLMGTPRWDLKLTWDAFTFPQWLGVPGLTLDPGHLLSHGRADAYALELTGGQQGGGLPSMHWAATAKGDTHAMELTQLSLQLLQGEVQASGTADWSNGVSATLGFAARTLDLSGFHPDLPQGFNAQGEVKGGFDQGRLALERLGIQLDGSDGALELSGTLTTDSAAPQLDATLRWSGLQWPLAADAPNIIASPSGTLKLKGTPEAYRVQLEGETAAPPIGTGTWQLTGNGGTTHFSIDQLRGEILGGVVSILGELGWDDAPSAHLTLAGEALQPDTLLPDWPAQAALSVTGGLELTGQAFEVRQLQVLIPSSGAKLTLDAQGELVQDALKTPLQAQLSWSSLAWPPVEESQIQSPSGLLTFAGTPSGYELKLETQTTGPGIPPSAWQLSARGDTSGLRLSPLQGRLLEGSLKAEGTLRWQPDLAWNLLLTGSGLDPAGQLPQLHGSLAFAAKSQGSLEADGLPKAKLELAQLKGELNGRRLQGRALLHTAQGRHRIEKLVLAAGDNQLNSSGAISPEQIDLEWKLALQDPGALLRGAAGALTAQGKIGGKLQTPKVQARLSGKDLAWDQLQLHSLDGRLALQWSESAPLELQLQADQLDSTDAGLLDHLRLTAKGALNDHQIQLSAKGPPGGLDAVLKGGVDLAKQQWAGRLTRLAADHPKLGPWRSGQAAPILFSAAESRVGPICLKGKGKLCLGFNRDKEGKSSLTADLEDVPLELLLPDVSGALSAKLDATLGPSLALAATAQGQITPGKIRIRTAGKESSFEHQGGHLTAQVNQSGLQAELLLQPLPRGRVEAQLALPRFNSLPLAEPQPLSGQLRAELPDLALVQSFAPQLSEVEGRLDADLRLGGSLSRPAVQGSVRLKDSAARVPAAGLALQELSLSAQADPQQPLRMLIEGGVRSGAGRIELQGQSDVQSGHTELTLKGAAFDAVNTADALVRIAPDINLAWDGEILHLHGELAIPEARITPQIDLTGGLDEETGATNDPGSAIAPSPDVVVVGQETTPEPPPAPPLLPLDGELTIVLGDAVSIEAVGFKSRLDGRLTLLRSPGQSDRLPRAKGTLNIREGSFRSFGQDLEIEWGRILFDDVPVTDPNLDIRAVRWIRDDEQVQVAGLHLTGTPQEPHLELFSRPQLDDDSIQSYLLTGRAPDSQQRVLSIGTQLRDDLYVGYGVNLIEKTHEFDLRYDILRWLGLEAAVGEADKTINFSYTWER